jgi:HEAT repeat protein
VLEALKNNSGDVRVAGLEALGKLGDESSVIVLAKAAAESPGPEQEAARRSLWAMAGSKIDQAIVAEIGSTSGKVRLELIAAAGERGISSAAGILSKATGAGDPEVRRTAVHALKNVGGPEQVPVLLDLVLGIDSIGSEGGNANAFVAVAAIATGGRSTACFRLRALRRSSRA